MEIDRNVHPASQAFGEVATTYQHARPGYPAAAIAHLQAALELGPDMAVLDLGAGTGKLTAQLLQTRARMVAVEPVDEMLEELRRRVPRAEARAGTAESIPADDGEFDAVVVAQAFHWFDHPRALDEIARVLTPGGALGLVWNRRDERDVLWVQVEQLLAPHRAGTPAHRDGAWRRALQADPRYAPLRLMEFDHQQQADADLLVDRVASISFVAALPERDRTGLLADVRGLATSSGRPPGFPLSHVTEVHTTRLQPRP